MTPHLHAQPGLMFEALRHGIDTLLTDIDTIYVKNPFDALFGRFKLGQDGLFMFGVSRCSLNTGIMFARATRTAQLQARIWAEASGPGPAGHYKRHDDQGVMADLCNNNTAFRSLNWPKHPSVPVGRWHHTEMEIQRIWRTYILDNCRGCHSPQLVVSHCTHGDTKIQAMKRCPGWWTPKYSTKNDNN